MKYIIITEYKDTSGYTEEKLYDLCCSIGNCEQLTPHSFIVSCEQNAIYIRDAIKNSPYDVDRIFVILVDPTAAWRNVMCYNSDLKALLY